MESPFCEDSSQICALFRFVSLASSGNRKRAGIEPKRAQSIDFKRLRKCRRAIQNILKTGENLGQVPVWANQLVQGKVLREGIGFGREDSVQSLIFHVSKRRLHKPDLLSKDKAPPKPNTSAASLFNSKRFYHSVQLNSSLRICGSDQHHTQQLLDKHEYLAVSPPRRRPVAYVELNSSTSGLPFSNPLQSEVFGCINPANMNSVLVYLM